MESLTSLQQQSLKKIYDAIIDFLDDFNNTDGFTGTLWYVLENGGSKNPEQAIYEYAENQIEKVKKVFLKEYFYLHHTDVYEKIDAFIENDLYDTFDGKLGYAYRFEAIPKGYPTTLDDYSRALHSLNEIIEQHTR